MDPPARDRRGRAGGSFHRRTRGTAPPAPREQGAKARERDLEKSDGLIEPGKRGSSGELLLPHRSKEKANFRVRVLCRVLGVSRSGYYDWKGRPPSKRSRQDAALTEKIREIHRRSRQTYGSPRVHAELRAPSGSRCSGKRVERLMRQAGLRGCMRGRTRGTTRRGKRSAAEDLLKRDPAWPGSPKVNLSVLAGDFQHISRLRSSQSGSNPKPQQRYCVWGMCRYARSWYGAPKCRQRLLSASRRTSAPRGRSLAGLPQRRQS